MRIKPADGEIYHIYNRGVEKRRIFLSDKDRMRFVFSLFLFNDKNAVLNTPRQLKQKMMEVRLPSKKALVEIMAFVLMPNHYHFMVKQLEENGITEFIRKMGTGYTNYFNKKYGRVGPLFQGKYKAVRISEEKHFIHLPYYIHLNPLDLVAPEWREKKINNIKGAEKFLESYRWSSHLDYIGIKNFPEILNSKILKEYFESPTQYKKDIMEWLSVKNIGDLEKIAIEPLEV